MTDIRHLALAAVAAAAFAGSLAPAAGADSLASGPGHERADTTAPSKRGAPSDRRGAPPQLIGSGPIASAVDCFVDFDDDLVLEYSILDHAEDTFMEPAWYESCFDSTYPAMAVKPMEYGHFHLGYDDDRIGPCFPDLADWGRKEEQMPTHPDDLNAWLLEPCVEDIDPVTEPRTGIWNHVPDQRAQIFVYDDEQARIPFELDRLQVTSGSVELCHLRAGDWFAAGPGASNWECLTLGEGYWNLSNHVDAAREVRVRFIGIGTQIENIGINLL